MATKSDRVTSMIFKAKSKFARKSRREQWMSYATRFVQHRSVMLEEWMMNTEKEIQVKIDNELSKNLLLKCSIANDSSSSNSNSNLLLRICPTSNTYPKSITELYQGANIAKKVFDNGLEKFAILLEYKFTNEWNYFNQLEEERLNDSLEKEAVIGIEKDGAMNLDKAFTDPDLIISYNCIITTENKNKRRAFQKIGEDYLLSTNEYSPFACIRDIVRGSIVCETVNDLIKATSTVIAYCKDEETDWNIIGVRDRFSTPSITGYRDIILYIEVDYEYPTTSITKKDIDDEKDNFIKSKFLCELQIHYVNMIRASRNDNGYHLYEYFRAYFGSTTYSTISTEIKLKAMKKMDQIANDPSQLDEFMDDFLRSGGRAARDLRRVWAFQQLFHKVGESDLSEIMLIHIINELRKLGEKKEDELLSTLTKLTDDLITREKFEESEKFASEAMSLCVKHKGHNHIDTANLLVTTGTLAYCQDDKNKSLNIYVEALQILFDLKGNLDPDYLKVLQMVAETKRDLKLFKESDNDFEELLNLEKKAQGYQSTQVGECLLNLGWSKLYIADDRINSTNFKKFQKLHMGMAASIAKKTAERDLKDHSPNDEKNNNIKNDDDDIYNNLDNPLLKELEENIVNYYYPLARSCFDQAKEIFSNLFNTRHISVAIAVDGISEVLDRQGRYAEALSCYDEASSIYKSLQGHIKSHHDEVDEDNNDEYIPPGMSETVVARKLSEIDEAKVGIWRESGLMQEAYDRTKVILKNKMQLLGKNATETAVTQTILAELEMTLDINCEKLKETRQLIDTASAILMKNKGADSLVTRQTLHAGDVLKHIEQQNKELKQWENKMEALRERERHDLLKSDSNDDAGFQESSVSNGGDGKSINSNNIIMNNEIKFVQKAASIIKVATSDSDIGDEIGEPPEFLSAITFMSTSQTDSSVHEADTTTEHVVAKRDASLFFDSFAGSYTAAGVVRFAHSTAHPLYGRLLAHMSVVYEDATLGRSFWFPNDPKSKGYLEKAIALSIHSLEILYNAFTGSSSFQGKANDLLKKAAITALSVLSIKGGPMLAIAQVHSNLGGLYRQKYNFSDAIDCFIDAIELFHCAEVAEEALQPKRAKYFDDDDDDEEGEDEDENVTVNKKYYLSLEDEELAYSSVGIASYVLKDGTIKHSHHDTIKNLNNIAQTLALIGKHDESAALFKYIIRITEQENVDQCSYAYNGLGLALILKYQTQKALNTTDNTIVSTKTISTDDEWDAEDIIIHPVLDSAIEAFTKAIEKREELYGRAHALTANILYNLAATYYIQGDWQKGGKTAEESLEIRERSFGKISYEVADTLKLLSTILETQNKYRRYILIDIQKQKQKDKEERERQALLDGNRKHVSEEENEDIDDTPEEATLKKLNLLEKDEDYVNIMQTQVTLILRKLEFEGRNLDYSIPEGWCNKLIESQ